ncbi:MAG: hypothetical protein JNG84_11705 [Archangium sp.]|nr:hypothetical protein [Archangium sp.]
MTDTERSEIEAQAERALRRGELSHAFTLFRQLTAAFPDDAALRTRVDELEGSLQPAELMSAKANFRAEPSGPPTSAVDDAEQRAARGDYAGAIAVYRRLLTERPDSQLLRERLSELFQLAQARPSAPRPRTREAMLSELLDRVGSRKRS